MIVSIWLMTLFIGAFSQDRYFNFVSPVEHGTPKFTMPNLGSVLRVEAVFEDNSFVASYAGTRFFYKIPVKYNENKILIEAGKAYEVVDKKLAIGHQITLIPIVK
jgi:hypothetical protein